MPKKRRKKKTKKSAKNEDGDATKQHNLRELFVRHAITNGWVQSFGSAFVLAAIALAIAIAMGDGVKSAAIALAAIGTITLWVIALVVIRANPSVRIVYFGGLSPGHVAAQPLPTGISPDAAQLMLGDDFRVLVLSTNPILMHNGKKFLSITLDDHGLMRLTATIMDSTNQWICRVINNEFQVNQDRAFNPKLIDEHTLLVRDAEGVEVLNLQFQSPKQIRITGRFQVDGFNRPVVIDARDGLTLPDGTLFKGATFDMTKTAGKGLIGF